MELLASSLAACTSITLRMYADRKDWNLESVEVTVNIETDTNSSRFHRQIYLIGDLNDDEKTKLLNIANRCPVHKLLSSTISINTSLQ